MQTSRQLVYRGYVTLNGRTTVELEVFKNKRSTPRNRWALYRTSNHSRDGFTNPDDAMAWGSKLNPKVVWKRELMVKL